MVYNWSAVLAAIASSNPIQSDLSDPLAFPTRSVLYSRLLRYNPFGKPSRVNFLNLSHTGTGIIKSVRLEK